MTEVLRLRQKRYRQEIMANLNAAVARSLIHSLPENLQARRARVEAYHQLLGNELGIELIRHSPGSACLTQVVRDRGERARRATLRQGL